MRLCPSVEGSPTPLITHRIGVDVCMARQRTFFHKCHRCIYRGKAANWEPVEPPLAMINVHAAEEPAKANVKPVKVKPKAKEPKAAPVKTPASAKAPAVAAKSANASG
jgi:hypothetical protein